ncbi:MAG: 50S ribosomal protein L13 [Acidilobaceae archaeon]
MKEVKGEIYIDGTNMILGRLASLVAKRLLEGNKVYVVNVDKIVVSGKKTMVIDSYKRTVLGVRSHYSHKWRPKRPRSPTTLFKKTVWGMLPKNMRGIRALKRLKAYIGVPEELKNKNFMRFSEADSSRLSMPPKVTLALIAKALGWRGGLE